MKKKFFTILLLLFSIAIGFSVGVSAWVVNRAVVVDTNFEIDKTPTKGYIKNYRSGESNSYSTFTRLENAVENANRQSGNIKVVVSIDSVLDVTRDFTIKSNVEVILPFEEGNNGYKTTAMGPNAFIDRTTALVTANRKILVRLVNSNITIEVGGVLSIGGETGQMGVSGSYAEINLNPFSSIQVYGTLNVFGYIKESNASHGNLEANKDTYDNSFDSYRYIKVKAGGRLYTALGLYNVPSGTILNTLNSAGILPINIFQFPNLQTYLTVEYQGVFVINAKITVPILGDQQADSTMVSTKAAGGNALFYINSGSISFEYCPITVGLTNNDRSPTRIITNGNIDVGFLKITAGTTITTEQIFLPISYKFQITVNSGVLSTEYKLKFMPGSILRINNGAIVENKSEVIFYKGDYTDGVNSPIYPTSGYDDARLINNGRINLHASAKLGAFIETERTDSAAIIDLTRISDQSRLSLSSKEGTNERLIAVTTTGNFYESSSGTYSIAQFKAGNIITSLNLGWVGEKYSMVILNIDFLNLYTTNVGTYQVFEKETINGTLKERTSGQTEGSSEIEVIENYYVEVRFVRIAGAELNGNSIISGYTFQITSDSTVTITPNKGIVVRIDGSSVSGNGDVRYTFSEYIGGIETKLPVVPNGALVKIIEGSEFSVNRTAGSTSISNRNFLKDPDKIPTTQPTTTDASFSFNQKLPADAYYRMFITQTAACIVPNSLVAMADGTYKEAQHIRPGDFVLGMNHETGVIESTPVIINHFVNEADEAEVLNLHFSNGSIVGVVGDHGFFDVDLNKYVYINTSNYNEFIGHKFYAIKSATNHTREDVILEFATSETKFVQVYSPVTAGYLNIITDNMLSMAGGIEGLFNFFEYDPTTLEWDKTKMQEDIEQYGLLSYEEFKDYIPEEIYLAINAKYLGVSIGKGLLTWEDIFRFVEEYADFFMA